MILDFRSPQALELPGDAVIVVGSGAAGLALALQLADDGQRVVLVESGGDVGDDEALRRSAVLNDGVVEGQDFGGLHEGRARVLGGTTQLWHGQCMRLHDIDLRHRPWVPLSGWPIGLDVLDAHYAAAERWLDVSGLGYDERRWAEHPRLSPVPWDERYLRHDFTEYLRDPVLGRVHRDRLNRHPLVWTLLNATAAAVRTEAGRAVGVELRGRSGRREEVRGRAVVLAAGSIENARLLLLSDPEGVGLGSGREHTGRYLQDHPIIRTAEVVAKDHRLLQDRYVVLRRGGRRLFPKVRLAPEVQEQRGLLDATAVFVHEPSPAFDAARRLLLSARDRRRPEHPVRDAVAAAPAAGRLAQDLVRRVALGRGSGARPAHVWLQLWVEQAPDPSRRVTLAEGRDALGLRQASIRWSVEPLELQTSRLLTRWVGHDLVRLGIGYLRELPAMRDDDAWRSTVTDAAHPAGTTRMSTDARGGVVDTDLMVHGVEGLYVVGGSVFPTSGYANPTLTIVALALRLADHLRGAGGQAGSAARPTSTASASTTVGGSGSAREAQA